MIHIIKSRLLKGVVTNKKLGDASVVFSRDDNGKLPKRPPVFEADGLELKKLIRKKFGKSLAMRQVDTGSCGACQSEIISACNPIYDLQRFGINFVASPRHADALLVSGCLSKNMLIALKKTYTAMPEPKFVITIGDCALDGGIFKGSYYVEGAIKGVLPVVLHIPGCPPSPIVIIQSLLAFLR